jgi:hypothetical protein
VEATSREIVKAIPSSVVLGFARRTAGVYLQAYAASGVRDPGSDAAAVVLFSEYAAEFDTKSDFLGGVRPANVDGPKTGGGIGPHGVGSAAALEPHCEFLRALESILLVGGARAQQLGQATRGAVGRAASTDFGAARAGVAAARAIKPLLARYDVQSMIHQTAFAARRPSASASAASRAFGIADSFEIPAALGGDGGTLHISALSSSAVSFPVDRAVRACHAAAVYIAPYVDPDHAQRGGPSPPSLVIPYPFHYGPAATSGARSISAAFAGGGGRNVSVESANAGRNQVSAADAAGVPFYASQRGRATRTIAAATEHAPGEPVIDALAMPIYENSVTRDPCAQGYVTLCEIWGFNSLAARTVMSTAAALQLSEFAVAAAVNLIDGAAAMERDEAAAAVDARTSARRVAGLLHTDMLPRCLRSVQLLTEALERAATLVIAAAVAAEADHIDQPPLNGGSGASGTSSASVCAAQDALALVMMVGRAASILDVMVALPLALPATASRPVPRLVPAPLKTSDSTELAGTQAPSLPSVATTPPALGNSASGGGALVATRDQASRPIRRGPISIRADKAVWVDAAGADTDTRTLADVALVAVEAAVHELWCLRIGDTGPAATASQARGLDHLPLDSAYCGRVASRFAAAAFRAAGVGATIAAEGLRSGAVDVPEAVAVEVPLAVAALRAVQCLGAHGPEVEAALQELERAL